MAPAQRLADIVRETSVVKREMRELAAGALTLYSIVQHSIASGIESLGLSELPMLANAVISNPAGFERRVYFNGAEVELALPISVVAHHQVLNITITTYVNRLHVTFIALREAIPDLQRLADHRAAAVTQLAADIARTKRRAHANIHPTERELLHPPFACFPLHEKDTFLGMLYIGFPKNRKISSQEMDLLLLVTEEMGEAIQLSHLLQKVEQTSSELAALHEMGNVATSTLKLEELLESIVRTGLKILQAKGGVLRIEDKKTKELKVQWSHGDYHHHLLEEKIAKRVFMTQTPFLLNHFREDNPILSILCVPLRSKERVLGTLAFYDKERLFKSLKYASELIENRKSTRNP